MSDGTLVKMADILPPLWPEDSGMATGWLLVALVSGALIAVWLRRRRDPLRRLSRDLAQDKLPPRAVAHRLAHLVSADDDLREELDRLRFQQQAPQTAAVAELIRRFSHGR